MALAKWSTLDGVGFNKKHDAPHPVQPANLRWSSWSGLRRRRVLFSLFALLGIYFFVKNIPTDVAPVGQRVNSLYGSLAPGHVLANAPQVHGKDSSAQHSGHKQYEGSIQFPNLASSLRPHLSMTTHNNVLFAIPELASASNLLPIACQMSQSNRSTVHMVVLGRQGVSVKDILKVNAITAEDCSVFWHDARPDHPLESSVARLAASIKGGLGHCCDALRSQLVFVDEMISEDAILGRLFQEVVTGSGVSLIALPRDVNRSMPWISTLDGSSLKKLKDVEIEIVIQANPDSAGPLIRLLHSLYNANYNGLFYPRLTIELPAQIDPFLSNFLTTFRWPPGTSPTESQLNLRHRINRKQLTAVDASMRTLESFYPRTASTSHVLLLHSSAELSPDYLHYLMFTVLEYRYGQDHDDLADSIFGISLEMPSEALNDQPLKFDNLGRGQEALILWQAPNNNAALIMGDRWLELRTFLSHRLVHDPELKTKSSEAQSISMDHPSWLAEILDLMQARGQYMMYPIFTAGDSDSKLVTLHRELHQAPEEYITRMGDKKRKLDFDVNKIIHDHVLSDVAKRPKYKETDTHVSATSALHTLMSAKGKNILQRLPQLRDMPMFSYNGGATDWFRSQSAAEEFADQFSLQQGGCPSLDSREKTKVASIQHLFCNVG